MLDKQNYKIIKSLQKMCPDGSYKVFDIIDLTKSINVKKEAFYNDLKYLKDNEFIDIKYTDETDVCLCILPKARQLEEDEKSKKYSHFNIMKVMLLSGILSGIMAFLGAFVAMLIIK